MKRSPPESSCRGATVTEARKWNPINTWCFHGTSRRIVFFRECWSLVFSRISSYRSRPAFNQCVVACSETIPCLEDFKKTVKWEAGTYTTLKLIYLTTVWSSSTLSLLLLFFSNTFTSAQSDQQGEIWLCGGMRIGSVQLTPMCVCVCARVCVWVSNQQDAINIAPPLCRLALFPWVLLHHLEL